MWAREAATGHGYVGSYAIANQVEEGSPQRGIAVLSLGIFGCVLLLRRWRAQLRIDRVLGTPIALFLLWAVVSLTWSADPALSFRRLIIFLTVWLAAFAVGSSWSLRRIMITAFSVSTVFLLVGICAEVALGTFHPFQAGIQYSGLDTGYRFCGTTDPNAGALEISIMLISAIFLFANGKRNRAFLIIAALGAASFLILSKTRTSFAAATAGLLAGCVIAMPRRYTVVALLGLGSLALGLYMALGTIFLNVTQRVFLLGREDSAATSATLTGRIPLWTELSRDVLEHPLIGYGYGAFWTPTCVYQLAQGDSSALNGYIDLMLSLGVVGATAYGFVILLGALKSIALYRISRNTDFLFMFAMLLFHSITILSDSSNMNMCFSTFIVLALVAHLCCNAPCEFQSYSQHLHFALS